MVQNLPWSGKNIYNKGFGHLTLTEFVLFLKTRHTCINVIFCSSGPVSSLYFWLNTLWVIALHLAVLTKITFVNKRMLRMEELLVVRLFYERITPLNGAIWANTNRSDLSAVVKLPPLGKQARWITGAGERKRWRKKRLTFVFRFPFTPLLLKAHARQERRSGQGWDGVWEVIRHFRFYQYACMGIRT